MAKTTAIEWCTATWNPWIGCTKASPACQNCYAERDMKRYGRDFNKVTRTTPATFNAPLKWKEPKKIFVCSWSDFYHADVPVLWRMDAYSIMERCPQHTFILLTKRPGNIKKMDYASWNTKGWPSNVWLGVTVENQEAADARIPVLLDTPAKLRFLSCEPLLGPVIIDRQEPVGYNPSIGVDWVIVGGESGPNARPMHPDWVRLLRDQCAETEVPYLFKQWGEWYPDIKGIYEGKESKIFGDTVVHRVGKKNAGCMLDGKEYKEFPKGVINDKSGRLEHEEAKEV